MAVDQSEEGNFSAEVTVSKVTADCVTLIKINKKLDRKHDYIRCGKLKTILFEYILV